MNSSSRRHPDDNALRLLALGRLDDSTAAVLRDHLASCLDCQRRAPGVASRTFPGALSDETVRPESTSAAGSTWADISRLAAQPVSAEPPPIHTLPQGLVDHPDFEIIRELGRGGMGVVYLAQNRLMHRKEVLKVVSADLVNSRDALERFQREIRAAASLHHTNIVTAYSAFYAGESVVFAMEYVEGYNLAQLVTGRGPLTVAQACNFVHQAALGLQYAHMKGMVHRDIKPTNLIVTREEKKPIVKVLDFGLAKISNAGQSRSSLTHAGQILGTPEYIAPEQIRDPQAADIRADIYSLGCTLYHLLAGRPPFAEDNVWALCNAHLSTDAQALNFVRPEVPVELASVVARAMAKDPDKRFQEPQELAQALVRFFKKANAPIDGSNSNVSQIDERTASQPTPPPVPTSPPIPTPPPIPAPPPVPTPLELPTHAPRARAGAKSLLNAIALAARPDRLITFIRSNRPKEETQLFAAWRRPPIAWLAVAAGILLFSFVVAWRMVFTANTKANVTPGASQEIDAGAARVVDVPKRRDNTRRNSAVRPVNVVATFFGPGDSEGWRSLDFNRNVVATTDRVDGPDNGNFWLVTLGAPNAPEWGWHAPAKFLGDHSDVYGKALSFRVWTDRADEPRFNFWNVVLGGRNIVLYVDESTIGVPQPRVWKPCRVPFSSAERQWKKFVGPNASEWATDEEIKEALSDVQGLRIRGQFSSQGSGACLDDVILGSE